MATYVHLIQFQDQGIRNIKDTVKRSDAAMAEWETRGSERRRVADDLSERSRSVAG